VDSFSVVVLEPGRKCCLAVGAAGEDLPVCPFGLQGPVEAFGFAVGPGAVGFDETLDGSEVRNGFTERAGVAVGESVVGDDAFDPVDAVAGEVPCGAGEELGCGDTLFVRKDLGVAEAGVVIDGDVDVVVADPASLDLLRAAMGPPAASFRDASELLDVQMDQFPGPGRSYRLVVVLTARIGAPVSGSHSASRGTPYRCRIRDTVRAGTPVSAAIRRGPNLTLRRASRTTCSRSELVRVGVDRGRLERSLSPACPSARKRLTHRYAVCRETPSYAAT
jgi:hypothetical protein